MARAAWSASRNTPHDPSMAPTTPPPPRRRWPPSNYALFSTVRLRLVFGIMRDKAAAEIAAILFPLAWQVIVTAPRQSRALAPESLRAVVDHPNLQFGSYPRRVSPLDRRCATGRRDLHHRLPVPGRRSPGIAAARHRLPASMSCR